MTACRLVAPETDGSDEWFGHGGAFGTQCDVNWHRRRLKLWVVQLCLGPRPWERKRNAAAEKFFKARIDTSGTDAYTGRVK